MTQGLTQPSGE